MKITELIKQHEEIEETISKIAFEHLKQYKEYYGEDAEKVSWVKDIGTMKITLKGEESWRYGGYDSWLVRIEVKDIVDPEGIKKKIIQIKKEKVEMDKRTKERLRRQKLETIEKLKKELLDDERKE